MNHDDPKTHELKLITYTAHDGQVIGIQRDLGRIERLFVIPPNDVNIAIIRRMVDAFNAMHRVSDKSLQLLADGGGSSGTAAERMLAWSLLVHSARSTGRSYLEKARAMIHKQGGT